jgi:hypothetical protein
VSAAVKQSYDVLDLFNGSPGIGGAVGLAGRCRSNTHAESGKISSRLLLVEGYGRYLQDTGCASVCQEEEAFIITISVQRTDRTEHKSVGEIVIS